MDQLDFQTWWAEFLAEPRHRWAKDGGHEAGGELTEYVGRLPPRERAAFESELLNVACARSDGWPVALIALERTREPQVLRRVADHVQRLQGATTADDQFLFGGFLRVLAGSNDLRYCKLVEQHLLHDPIGLYWPSVPWALWPHQPDLFGRAWARYFSQVPVQTWRGKVIVQAFLSKASALAAVRDSLRSADEPAWHNLREAVRSGLDAPWVGADERARVKLVCDG